MERANGTAVNKPILFSIGTYAEKERSIIEEIKQQQNDGISQKIDQFRSLARNSSGEPQPANSHHQGSSTDEEADGPARKFSEVKRKSKLFEPSPEPPEPGKGLESGESPGAESLSEARRKSKMFETVEFKSLEPGATESPRKSLTRSEPGAPELRRNSHGAAATSSEVRRLSKTFTSLDLDWVSDSPRKSLSSLQQQQQQLEVRRGSKDGQAPDGAPGRFVSKVVISRPLELDEFGNLTNDLEDLEDLADRPEKPSTSTVYIGGEDDGPAAGGPSDKLSVKISPYHGEARRPARLDFLPRQQSWSAGSPDSPRSADATPVKEDLQNELVATLKRSNLKKRADLLGSLKDPQPRSAPENGSGPSAPIVAGGTVKKLATVLDKKMKFRASDTEVVYDSARG